MPALLRDQQLHCRAAAELILERINGQPPTIDNVRGHAIAEGLRSDVLETLVFGHYGDLFDPEFVDPSDELLRRATDLAAEARG